MIGNKKKKSLLPQQIRRSQTHWKGQTTLPHEKFHFEENTLAEKEALSLPYTKLQPIRSHNSLTCDESSIFCVEEREMETSIQGSLSEAP